MDDSDIVEDFISSIKYNNDGLVPVIIQDFSDNQVLMMAYMNRESLYETIETKRTVFWSRSRQCIWRKGDTSGHIQRVKEIYYDCDNDTLLFKVEQNGGACHTGNKTCFYRRFEK